MNDTLPPVVPYIGRFAPSPTGPLHFGSLVSALASFLDAKANQGRWLVRLEDIDPPRTQPGADKKILCALEAHGLHWNDEVLYQSSNLPAYRHIIDTLISDNQAYYCDCSRQMLKNYPVYPGFCVSNDKLTSENAAIRVRVKDEDLVFEDEIQGRQSQQLRKDIGDFVIFRKDGLVAYQLAVAVDDSRQRITKVVRGSDLLDSTFRQVYLQKLLQLNTPGYAHIPVIIGTDGKKLSKQNYAKPLDPKNTSNNLYLALKALKLEPSRDLINAPPSELVQWGVVHWDIGKIPRKLGIEVHLP